MPLRRYLPSVQLVSIALSLALSAGLVFAADVVTHRTEAPAEVAVGQNSTDTNWQAALDAIQAQNASSTFITPDQNAVADLIQAVQSPNVTDTVGKTLLINLTNAKAQGLGSDIPTQDQIVAAAAAQLKSQQASAKPYSAADLTIIPTSNDSLHTYGNAFIGVLGSYPNASEKATLLSIDYAVEGHDSSQPKVLAKIGDAYGALAHALAGVSVPQTLAPLHLQAVNDFLLISATFDDMQNITADPLRGLQGLQTYESLMDEEARVLTYIAQDLSKNAILFNKDEPGGAWSAFLSTNGTSDSLQ